MFLKKTMMAILLVSVLISQPSNSGLTWDCVTSGLTWACVDVPGKCLSALATPRGVTGLACVYGISQGISNFLWAFNWVDHADFSPETAAIIQEAGGLSAAAECIIIGAIAPFIFYEYSRHNPLDKRNTEENDDAAADDDDDDVELATDEENPEPKNVVDNDHP